MEIEETKNGALVVVAPAGRLDGTSAPELEARIAAIVDRGDAQVVLDCGKLDYISSAGLRSVLVGARKCQQGGGNMAVCALQPACRSVMEVSGFLSILDCYDTLEAAVAAKS